MNRRGFLTGLVGIACAPAIVRASSLMPISTAANGYSPSAVSLKAMAEEYNRSITHLIAEWQRQTAQALSLDLIKHGTAIIGPRGRVAPHAFKTWFGEAAEVPRGFRVYRHEPDPGFYSPAIPTLLE